MINPKPLDRNAQSNNGISDAGNRNAAIVDLSALLFDVLAYKPDEFVSVCHKVGDDGVFVAEVCEPGDAVARVDALPDKADIYFGVSPVAGPARVGQKGRAEDVTRLAALFADLDVKDGSCVSLDVAQAIISELSKVLDTRPSVITNSGGGLHPYWPISYAYVGGDEDLAVLLRRWGRLVKAVAEKHGAKADSVFNLDRILRAPGTYNCKAATNGHGGVPVVCYADSGRALMLAEISARLDEYGVIEEEDDREATEEISDPNEWEPAEDTCAYAAKWLKGIPEDGPLPGGGRHQWLLSQAVRMACAVRLGCLSAADYMTARDLLLQRMIALRAKTRETCLPYEVLAAFEKGIEKAAGKTDAEASAELKGHTHDGTGKYGWLSDANVSKLLVERVLQGRYCWARGLGWMKWDGQKWSRTAPEDVVEQSRLFARALVAGAVASGAEPDVIKAYTKRMSSGAINAAANLAKGQLLVDASEFDCHPDLLNVGNGIVDLRTGELMLHDPKLLLTKFTPTYYYPDATHVDWDAALTALPKSRRDWLQVRFGQAITGHPTPDDILPILWGSGENGKTTLTVGIACAAGEHATILPERVLLANPGDHPTEMMTLRGARLALLEETPEARHLNVKRLKDLLGTPKMTARLIQQDSVTWDATHSVVVSTNYRPRVNETDHGTWRRLALVGFPYTFRREGEELSGPNDRRGDSTLRERIKLSPNKQHEAILRWLVDGAMHWYANGQVMPLVPKAIAESTRQWRYDSDPILRWYDDQLIADPGRYVMSSDMFEGFQSLMKASGHHQWTAQTFGERFGQHDEITSHGITAARVRPASTDLIMSRLPSWIISEKLPERVRAWLGVRFRDEADNNDKARDQAK